MAPINADCWFIWIDTGRWGHQSDRQLYGDSELTECIEDKSVNFPNNDLVQSSDRDMPFFILGDDTFPPHEAWW